MKNRKKAFVSRDKFSPKLSKRVHKFDSKISLKDYIGRGLDNNHAMSSRSRTIARHCMAGKIVGAYYKTSKKRKNGSRVSFRKLQLNGGIWDPTGQKKDDE